MARNDEQDPELERDLRGHFTSNGGRPPRSRRPVVPIGRPSWGAGRPLQSLEIGWQAHPPEGDLLEPCRRRGTVAAAALVATISVWSATDGFSGGGQPSENFQGSSENFVVVTREVEVMEKEVTVVVTQPTMVLEREVTRVVEMQAEVMERVITATPAPPRGVLGPRSERGPQGEQGVMGDQGPRRWTLRGAS